MSTISSKQLRITCAGSPKGAPCTSTDVVPARKRWINSPDEDLVPVAPHPFICLSCWREGWRADMTGVGGSWSAGWMVEDPSCKACGWRVYVLPGHPQTIPTEVKP